MLTQITTVQDVIRFANQLKKEGTIFHPDDDFSEIIDLETKESTYILEEAQFRNQLMDQCFQVCRKAKVDIYETMMDAIS